MRGSKAIVIGGIGLVLALCLHWWRAPRMAEHAGRPVSAWFADLCSGVYGGTPRANGYVAAYDAFSVMETNAIPYLTQQLSYDRSGRQQKVVVYLRRYAVSKRLGDYLMWPTARRNYAAVALRQMGPKAEAAIPALLEAWANDVPEVKVNVVSALESILGRTLTEGVSQAEWKKLEAEVIAEAAVRYPRAAEDLGIDVKRGAMVDKVAPSQHENSGKLQ